MGAVSWSISSLISLDVCEIVAGKFTEQSGCSALWCAGKFMERCVFVTQQFIDSMAVSAEVPVASCARGYPVQSRFDRRVLERGRINARNARGQACISRVLVDNFPDLP